MRVRHDSILTFRVALGFVCALACCGSSAADIAPERHLPSSVVIVSTGNLRGIFEPCRCPTNPYGGVARRVTWIGQYRVAHPDTLFLDSGDVFDSGTSRTWGDLLTWGYRLSAVALADGKKLENQQVEATLTKEASAT